jgi:pre-rRNA-processing protein TSR3
MPLPTIIVRDRREKSSKCSVTPLRGREDFRFHRFPMRVELDLTGYVRLGLGGPDLGPADADKGLLVLDASWHHVAPMEQYFHDVPVRSLPPWLTAFPRLSKLGRDPEQGLATVEAVFAALTILGRSTQGILDSYHWRAQFLELNQVLLPGTGAALTDEGER